MDIPEPQKSVVIEPCPRCSDRQNILIRPVFVAVGDYLPNDHAAMVCQECLFRGRELHFAVIEEHIAVWNRLCAQWYGRSVRLLRET